MGVFDLLSGPSTPEEHLIDFALKRYTGYQMGERLTEKVLGNDDDDLEHESKVLDNALKRRAMGIPNDSDDYEELVNEGRYIRPKHVAAIFGSKASALIPDPNFMKPRNSVSGLFSGGFFGGNPLKDTILKAGESTHGRLGTIASLLRRAR